MTEKEFNIQQKIVKLEKQLEEVKATNKTIWDTFGSELCTGDMLKREEEFINNGKE